MDLLIQLAQITVVLLDWYTRPLRWVARRLSVLLPEVQISHPVAPMALFCGTIDLATPPAFGGVIDTALPEPMPEVVIDEPAPVVLKLPVKRPGGKLLGECSKAELLEAAAVRGVKVSKGWTKPRILTAIQEASERDDKRLLA